MHKMILSERWANEEDSSKIAGSKQERTRLLEEFRTLAGDSVRFYRIGCSYNGMKFVVVTASKEVHLSFGRLAPPMQGLFCNLLDEECERSGEDIIQVLHVDEATGQVRKSGLLVSRSETKIDNENVVQFLIGAAH